MAYQTLIVEIADHVALIRLNRPEALNALSGQLVSELAAAMKAADADAEVRTAVLTHTGGTFCAGTEVICRRWTSETRPCG